MVKLFHCDLEATGLSCGSSFFACRSKTAYINSFLDLTMVGVLFTGFVLYSLTFQ
ncbi:hypothetical protein RHMOL_Rhmol09G0001400 [Rhododendron molle]|uniref:Uncharacterized protein n=1 Tax=Rhododendron molle TaxID=49168 RepID=A0ACC0M999_RHOML|nr:hypothetical protein RHMOL_Rhmol09G0001400 [Rhododendron molle]